MDENYLNYPHTSSFVFVKAGLSLWVIGYAASQMVPFGQIRTQWAGQIFAVIVLKT